jgi:hypothetical protein
VTPEPPIRPDADLRGIADMPADVEAILALAQNVPAEAFKATMLLHCHAWHQVPAGSLPDEDDKLRAMVELERPVWEQVRAQALTGFTLCADGRLYDPGIVEKAIIMLAEVEKRERRKADDRRRQKLHYDRKVGKAPPKPNTETSQGVGDRHHDETSAAPPPAPHPNATAPSQPNAPVISHDDPVRDVKSHVGNGQTGPTALASPQHETVTKIEPTKKPTIREWDDLVKNYRVHGHWSWRELGPSPQSPGCRAPSFVLIRHGYREAQA